MGAYKSAAKLHKDKALSEITSVPALKALALANLGLTDVAGNNVAIASGKTFAVSNTLTLAGTDSTTMTFPATSSTLARTSGTNTFTGVQTMTSPSLITPAIGVATGASLAVTAGLTSSGSTGAGIGYATGAGGTVTQITNRSTGVTLSKLSGSIQTDTTSLAAAAAASFTVTNTTVEIGDVVATSIRSGATTNQTRATVTTVAAGSFVITIQNSHASTAETGAIVINFAVIKAVSA